MMTYDATALDGQALIKLGDEMVSDLLQHSRINREQLFEPLDLLKKILRHIGHRPYIDMSV